MDKRDYQGIFGAVKTHTGKEVEFLGKDGDISKTDEKKD